MKELDHICLIRLHEVIDEANGDKLCMSKKTYTVIHLLIVIDYAKFGQVMNWDQDTLKFSPCFGGKP